MELIDVLNSEGIKTGEIVSKAEVHAKGLWHRAAHIWFVNSKNEILLQLRSKDKETSPDRWDISAAGHLSSGDDAITGAMRETYEELGLSLDPQSFVHIGEVIQHQSQSGFVRPGYINKEFNDVYVVRKDLDVKDLTLQTSEVQEVKWIPFVIFKEMVISKDPTLVHHEKEFELLFRYLGV